MGAHKTLENSFSEIPVSEPVQISERRVQNVGKFHTRGNFEKSDFEILHRFSQ